MRGIKAINKNPAEQSAENFLAATNAVAEQNVKRGLKSEFLTAANAKEVYKKIIKSAVALVNPSSRFHNQAYNAFKEQLGSNVEAFNELENVGMRYMSAAAKYAQDAQKSGLATEEALETAFNSLAGNPVFDHFGNLNLLAGQLFEEMAFIETFLTEGDAFAVPTENGGTDLDKTRFRAPTEQVVGSAKLLQGDINPSGHIRDDANRTQVNLINEFKNANTLETVFSITQAMRDQALGYASSVQPALGGFILQNRYFQTAQKQVMKLAELMFVDGSNPSGNYVSGTGGSYGILSPNIQLALADYQAASPQPATAANWAANPTKLVQVISNYNYVPITVAAQLPTTSVDSSLMYKDIVRLFTLIAQQNVDFKAREYVLYVPTTIYALLVQYPGTQSGATGQGVFNRTLEEMIMSATSGVINKIKIVPSSLMNYRASNAYGQTTNAFNYMLAVAQGCEGEKKPVIMPGQTAVPYVVSENVSATIMNFRTQYLFGGPMFMHYGGAALMKFNKAS